MTDRKRLKAFIDWIQSFDNDSLQNEDDVETKFVLPFFRHLGYPDRCRRGKYPLTTYRPGKPGRKPEIDQLYFATQKPEEQSPDTSLVLVEAKAPEETNLDKDVAQARFYGNYVTPVFIVITNGSHLKILKRHRYRGEEPIFDDRAEKLRNAEVATRLFNQLNFGIAKHVKETLANVLTHRQYVKLEQTLSRYSNLQAILDQGDFQPFKAHEDQHFTVVRPKVAIRCSLPVAFDRGYCEIEFSNITLRGLTIHLTHEDILANLMIGLGTEPHLRTRRFLRRMENGSYEIRLGEVAIFLSEAEVLDLCACVDEISQKYKGIIEEAETALQTWHFPLIQTEDIAGFHLLSVEPWLWKLMKQFADTFDYGRGNSEWHIFYRQFTSIRVGRGLPNHAFIWPVIDENDPFLSTTRIGLLAKFPAWSLNASSNQGGWIQNVGRYGIWSTTHIQNWLLHQFIPAVHSHYPQKFPAYMRDPLDAVLDDYYGKYPNMEEIDEPKQLWRYLLDVQSWLHGYPAKSISSKLLLPYYDAFIDLVGDVDASNVSFSYIAGNLASVDWRTGHVNEPTEALRKYTVWKDIISSLTRHSEKVRKSSYEDSFNADLISRVFLAIVKDGLINFSQAQLNTAKESLLPVWYQSRFETRHVFSHWLASIRQPISYPTPPPTGNDEV